MNVLSLFDGCSGGNQALEMSGIKVANYYACEIDKYAIQVTQANYPNTIKLGDVTKVDFRKLPKIDLLIGGSPCQSFSFAGKRNGMSTKDSIEILTLDHYLELKKENYEFDGQSYLFWEYMNALTILKPKYFLLENVEMGEKWEKVLSKAIGVNGIHINSALLTAQNRKRIYWTNIGMVSSGLFGDLESIIKQPKDKKIVLKDILENEVNEKYFLSEKAITGILSHKKEQKEKGTGFGAVIKNENEKMNSLKVGGHGTDDLIIHNMMPKSSKTGKGGTGHLSRNDGKTYCLDTGNTNALEIMSADYRSDEGVRWRKDNKTPTLMARARNDIYGPTIINTSRIRRLTPLECERLQGMKDKDFFCIFDLCLEKAKNYVNVVQKNLKLQKLVLNAEQSELNELVKVVYQNMSVNHQSIKYTAHQNVDIQTQSKTKKTKKTTLQENTIIVNNADIGVMSNYQKEMEGFVQQNVSINIIEGKIIHCGMEELLQIDNDSINQKNGNLQSELFGIEIMQIVEYVNAETTKAHDTHSIYTILYPSNIKNLEQILIIYYLFAKNVISGYTQNTIQKKNILLKFKIKNGYTNFVSDSQRYKMIGNGWTIPVISHIFNYLKCN